MARAFRRAIWALPLVVPVWLFLVPSGGGDLRVLGDGAPDVRAALQVHGPMERARDIDVVLLRRRENLRHVPEVGRLCRGRCTAALTSLYEVGLGGGRKILVVDLSAWDGIDALDRGDGLPDDIAICVAEAVRREAGRLFPPDPPACLPSHRWRVTLPYGL
ncbi:hypothetical protein [Jannaschia sp. 2305UL9-9]|uniref:hypothetical protein n=1 Tax=Jannaschia sp. 2305UL9-9 TaxID=3121638 RepID=UPI003528C2B9